MICSVSYVICNDIGLSLTKTIKIVKILVDLALMCFRGVCNKNGIYTNEVHAMSICNYLYISMCYTYSSFNLLVDQVETNFVIYLIFMPSLKYLNLLSMSVLLCSA